MFEPNLLAYIDFPLRSSRSEPNLLAYINFPSVLFNIFESLSEMSRIQILRGSHEILVFLTVLSRTYNKRLGKSCN